MPRRRAGLDHAVAAIDQRDGDGDAAERLHQRAGAIADTRASLLDSFSTSAICASSRCLHLVFEREGFHDADALQGFLHRFHDQRAAGELVARDGADAADELAQHQHRRRRDEQRDQR